MEPGRKDAWRKMKVVADMAAEAAESLYEDPAGVDYFDLDAALADIETRVGEVRLFVQDPPFERSVTAAIWRAHDDLEPRQGGSEPDHDCYEHAVHTTEPVPFPEGAKIGCLNCGGDYTVTDGAAVPEACPSGGKHRAGKMQDFYDCGLCGAFLQAG